MRTRAAAGWGHTGLNSCQQALQLLSVLVQVVVELLHKAVFQQTVKEIGKRDPDGRHPEVEEDDERTRGWDRNPVQEGHAGLGAILPHDHAHLSMVKYEIRALLVFNKSELCGVSPFLGADFSGRLPANLLTFTYVPYCLDLLRFCERAMVSTRTGFATMLAAMTMTDPTYQDASPINMPLRSQGVVNIYPNQ